MTDKKEGNFKKTEETTEEEFVACMKKAKEEGVEERYI